MVLMHLRSRSHVKASMLLMRADHLSIHNYIRSPLNIILRPILLEWARLEPVTYCLYTLNVSVAGLTSDIVSSCGGIVAG